MKPKSILLAFTVFALYAIRYTPISAQQPELISETTTNQDQATQSAATPSPTPPPPPTEGIGFTVSPSVLLINTDPGTSQVYPLKIKNNSPDPEAISISLKKVTSNPNGKITFAEFESSDQVLSWINFDQEEFVIQPDSWKQVDMTFSPNNQAKLGYYFAVLFNRQEEVEAEEGITQVTGAPAIIALADIASDDARPELTLVDFKTTKTWYDFLPVEFELTLQNTGNIHLMPFGNVFIDQGSTKDIGLLTINESAGQILPGMSRTFSMSWEDGFPIRITNPEDPEKTKISWNLENAGSFRLGKFTATALAAYDDGQRDVPLESTIQFWVIPWQIILAVLIIGLFILIGAFAILRLILKPFKRNK